MLDRTIPFYNIILRCDQVQQSEIHLPAGYAFQQYQEGFEDAWAFLEYEIGDFAERLEDNPLVSFLEVQLQKQDTFSRYENQYEDAMAIIMRKMQSIFGFTF